MAKLTVPVNTGGGSGPLDKKVYKKVGSKKITLEQEIQDLQNWFYEEGSEHIFAVPKWDDITFQETHTLFYDDDSRRMSYYVNDNVKSLLIIDLTDNNKNYIIYSSNYSTYEANKWYSNGQVVNTPNFTLDDNFLQIDISIGREPYENLFNSIYGTDTSLKEKFDGITKYIDQESTVLLKNKYYDLNQTMQQKLEEGIENWNYIKGTPTQKPLYDISSSFADIYGYLSDIDIIPNNNESSYDNYLYTEPNKFRVVCDVSRYTESSVAHTDINFNWLDIPNNTRYECYLGKEGDAINFVWRVWPLSNNSGSATPAIENPTIPDPVTITSQDDLPSFIYNQSYVEEGYPNMDSLYALLNLLIITVSNSTTLKQKIDDLQNWTYEKVTASGNSYKPVFDMASVLMANAQTFDDAGLFSNVNNEPLYVDSDMANDNDLGIYWTFDGETIDLVFKIPHDDENGYYAYVCEITSDGQDAAAEWAYYFEPYDFQQGDLITLTPITSADDLPTISIDENYIQEGYENVVPLLVEASQSEVTISLKDKFQSCLTLVRLSNITILSTDITEQNTNSYASSPYLYIWKVTLEDDAFIDALKIETIFDLDEVAPENICPFQDIDTENGTLTLYVKEKSDIVISRIDIFKNVK